jgi:hypothetical protein
MNELNCTAHHISTTGPSHTYSAYSETIEAYENVFALIITIFVTCDIYKIIA